MTCDSPVTAAKCSSGIICANEQTQQHCTGPRCPTTKEMARPRHVLGTTEARSRFMVRSIFELGRGRHVLGAEGVQILSTPKVGGWCHFRNRLRRAATAVSPMQRRWSRVYDTCSTHHVAFTAAGYRPSAGDTPCTVTANSPTVLFKTTSQRRPGCFFSLFSFLL